MANTGPGGKRIAEYTLHQLRGFDEFLQANPDLERPLDASQPRPPLGTVGRMLKRAIDTSNSCVYSLVLRAYLEKIGLKAPTGVFVLNPKSASRAGRPLQKVDRFRAWLEYSQMKNPSDSKVARKLIPDEYKQNPKAATDKVRQRRKRFERRFPNEELRRAVLEFVLSEAATKSQR